MSSELAELFMGVQLEVRLLRSRITSEAPLNMAFNQELNKLEGQMERCWDASLKLATSQTLRRPAPPETIRAIQQNLEWVRSEVRKLIRILDDRKKSALNPPFVIPTLESLVPPAPSPTPSTASSTTSVSTQYSAAQYYQPYTSSPFSTSQLVAPSPTASSSLNFNGSIFGHDSTSSPMPSIYWSTTPPPRPPTPDRYRTPLRSTTDSGYFGSSSSSVSSSSFNPPSTPKYQPLPLKKTKRN